MITCHAIAALSWPAWWLAPMVALIAGGTASRIVARQPHWALMMFWLAVILGLTASWRAIGSGGERWPLSFSACTNVAIVLSIVICAFGATESASTRRRRYLLMRTHPTGLIDAPTGWPSVIASSVVAGALTLVAVVSALILSPNSNQGWANSLTLLAVSGTVLASGVTLMFFLNRNWSQLQAHVGAGLLSASACLAVVALVALWTDEASFRSARMLAIIATLSVMALLWNWLHRVWQQQLDGLTPWTTAGRLWFVNRDLAFANLLAGLLAVGSICHWRTDSAAQPFGAASTVVASLVFLLFLAAAFRSWRRWNAARFLVLTVLACAGLTVFLVPFDSTSLFKLEASNTGS